MDTARAHLFIEGRVQGVCYRFFTRNVAETLGLHGWVRNLRDGRVEALFEGRRDSVEKAIQQCKNGPPGARVTNIEVLWEQFNGEQKEFEIRY
jgi:acylphosphatase